MNKKERIQELRREAVSHAASLSQEVRDYLGTPFYYACNDEEEYDYEISYWESVLKDIKKEEEDKMNKVIKVSVKSQTNGKTYTFKCTRKQAVTAKRICLEATYTKKDNGTLELKKPEGILDPAQFMTVLKEIKEPNKPKKDVSKKNYAIKMSYKDILNQVAEISIEKAIAFNKAFVKHYDPATTDKDQLIRDLLEHLATQVYELPEHVQEDTEPLTYNDGHLNLKLVQMISKHYDQDPDQQSFGQLLISSITKHLGYNW